MGTGHGPRSGHPPANHDGRTKKKIDTVNQLPPCYLSYAPEGEHSLRLYVDEMCSFVRCKKAQRWLWQVGDAETGQVAAFVFGRRTHATYRRLLTVLKAADWVIGRWFTDAWGACEACLPAEQRQTGKAPMQPLERKHLPLCTRLKRLTRKTICFLKSNSFTVV